MAVIGDWWPRPPSRGRICMANSGARPNNRAPCPVVIAACGTGLVCAIILSVIF